MANNKSFYPMNMLIKGTAEDIKVLLDDPSLPAYKLAKESTYNPKKAADAGKDIVEARVIFEMYNCKYMETATMLINKYPVRFLILGSGGDEYRSDGTYAIFKDYTEGKPSVVEKFEKYSNPHMEEFEGQENVIKNVWKSFLDHEWSFSYLDYSCGENVPYRFKGKKVTELINRWNME